MDQIYGCSYITICLLTASCNLSFFGPETHTTTIGLKSGINLDIQGQYCISYYYISSFRSGAGIVVDRLMESRWSGRGWTFQETFLSARLLCFEQSEISFACSDRMVYRSGLIGARQFESPCQLQDDLQDPQ
ncbi:hypothetical protein B0O99DRAFT_343246 [Bisporella sp. PMI_857]|nr:hypothetical protein B0O99DRAFT_343246 [Bisporella sp. PMI_857]